MRYEGNKVVISESELRWLVNESAKNVLNENSEDEGVWGGIKNAARGIGNGNFHMMQNYRSGSYASSIQKYGQAAQKALGNFKNILDRSGAQQIGAQVANVSQELGKIMTNYQTIATNASNAKTNQNFNTNNTAQTVPNTSNTTQTTPENSTTAQTTQEPTSRGFALRNGMERQVYNDAVAKRGAQKQTTTSTTPENSNQSQDVTAAGGAANAENTRSRSNFDSQYQNMGKMNLNQGKTPRKVMPESRRIVTITPNYIRSLVNETLNILMNEEGESGGGGATNAAGVMQGGGTNPGAGQYDVPAFGGKTNKKKADGFGEPIMRQAHNLGDVTQAKANQVDIGPALKRGGSIAMNRQK
jgi:hypothetical protein